MSAQGSADDALLHEKIMRYQYVGLAVGYGYWKSDADFGITDNSLPCARFSDGDGHGPVVEIKGIFYPLQSTWFLVSPRLRYETRSGSFITALPGEPVRGENNERVILQQEAQVDASMATLTLEGLIGLEFAETGLYMGVGGSAGLLLDGLYDYTERILSPEGFVYAENGETEKQLLGGREFETYKSITFDLRGALGYMYRASDTWAFNIEAVYAHPITSSFKDPDMLKQQGFFGTLGILYNFGD